MLSTPGRSPRHLPPLPSPSPSARKDGPGAMGPPLPRRRQAMPRDVEVLDEDTYVEAIEHIVQRDYFPDIPRLQDRLQWLEAIRSGDPELIRAARARTMAPLRRAERQLLGTPGRPSAPSSPSVPVSASATPRSVGGTPFSVAGTEALSTPRGGRGLAEAADAAAAAEEEAAKKRERTSMSLDAFLLRHTSQDNASFAAIKEREAEKQREKAARLYLPDDPAPGPASGISPLALGGTAEGSSSSSSSSALVPYSVDCTKDGGKPEELGRQTDGYGSTGQPTSTLQACPYKARNTLMYDSSNREDAPLTKREVAEQAMGPPKKVKYQNTRFQTPGNEEAQKAKLSLEDTVAILYSPVAGETPQRYVDPTGVRGSRKHYDLEDLKRTPRATSAMAVNAAGTGDEDAGSAVPCIGLDGKPKVYEYVSTPSFIPGEGVEASPFMTWGDVDSTPLRLEAEDTPLGIGGSADGPHFQIPSAAARDEVAMNMSRAAAKSLKKRQQRRAGETASPAPPLRGGASPALSPWNSRGPLLSPAGAGGLLSPAAQKLASTAAQGKGSSVFDASLRASYAASPLRSPSTVLSAKKIRDSALKRARGSSLGPVTAPGRSPLQPSPSPAKSRRLD